MNPLKLILIIGFAAIIHGCATNSADSSGPTRMVGEDISVEAAKNQAFRKAVEFKLGAIILSKRVVVNDELKEKITNFSSGFVDKYEVVSVQHNGGLFKVTVDVWVKDSSLAGALVRQYGQSDPVDGSALDTALRQRDFQRLQGADLINELTKGWPHTGISVGPIENYRFDYTGERGALLVISSLPFGYSQGFDKGLREALRRLSVSPRGRSELYLLRWRNNGFFNGLLDGNPDRYFIPDAEVIRILEKAFSQRIYLRISLMSGNRRLGSSCIFLENTSMERVWIHPGPVLWHEMPTLNQQRWNLSFDVDRSLIRDVTSVKAEVVKSTLCEPLPRDHYGRPRIH